MSRSLEQLRKVLADNDLFVTNARKKIFLLLQNNEATSVRELVKLAKPIDQATVYRTLNTFEKLRIIKKVWLGRNTKYELGDAFQNHHHHLSCTNCGTTIALPHNEELEALIKQVGSYKGFEPREHQLDIIGLCRTCQRSNSK